jgi:phosphoglycerate dehydrogenase-like enzyme
MASTLVEVLVTLQLSENLVDRIKQVSPRVRITHLPVHRAEDIPGDIWKRTEILFTQSILPDPEKAPNLRWIQFNMAGIDNQLAAPIFQRSNVTFTTLSGAAAPQIAEYILTMMLALGHHLNELHALQSKAEWPRERPDRFNPRELRSSIVGIIGYGSIGRELARLLQPFQVTILATKRDVMHPRDTGYTPDGLGDPEGNLFHRLYPIEAMRSMLRECDYVIVTVPLTPKTRGLLKEEEFRAMKPGAFLIDVSRGEVVDHKALLQALQENRLAGAALDVFPEEPLPANSPLWKSSNVIISPHIAGSSTLYKDRGIALFNENLRHYLNGLPLLNRFEAEKGY